MWTLGQLSVPAPDRIANATRRAAVEITGCRTYQAVPLCKDSALLGLSQRAPPVRRVISMARLFRRFTVRLVVPRRVVPQSGTTSEIGSHLRSLQLIPIIRTFYRCTADIVVIDAKKIDRS